MTTQEKLLQMSNQYKSRRRFVKELIDECENVALTTGETQLIKTIKSTFNCDDFMEIKRILKEDHKLAVNFWSISGSIDQWEIVINWGLV